MADGRGGARPGAGRPKGSKTKPQPTSDDVKNLAKMACREMNCDPFRIIANIAKQAKDIRVRLDAAKELAKYLQAQQRPVTALGPAAQTVAIQLNINGKPDTTVEVAPQQVP